MDSSKIKKIVDFETKRSIHINMTRATHAEFKKKLIDYNLSMQEVIEYFAYLVGQSDSKAIRIVEESYSNKRDKQLNKITDKEADNLFDAIAEQDPFS